LKDKLSGWFHKDCGCDTCDSCCGGGWGSGTGLHERFSGLFHKDCGCDTCNTCNTCNTCDSCKPCFLDRLRGLFHHDCCDTCETCNTCNSCGSTTMAPPKAEPIPAPKGAEPPKKMPEPPTKKVQIIPSQPAGAPGNSLLIDQ